MDFSIHTGQVTEFQYMRIPKQEIPAVVMKNLQDFSDCNQKALADLVKMVQKKGMKGDKGGWKEFLLVYDKKMGTSVSDPARRSKDDLAAFLNTFTNGDDLKVFARVMQCQANCVVEKLSDSSTSYQKLVDLTIRHRDYPFNYSFPSHKEEWLIIKVGKLSKAKNSNSMVAVDCEMVLCEDGTEALVQVCAVDPSLEVKLNELVKPNKAIADYRTEITGITADDLEKATCSLADIQKSMRRLLSHGTILVGHSLNNDLEALKLDHVRVVDTSFIFKSVDAQVRKRPSLNDLCKVSASFEKLDEKQEKKLIVPEVEIANDQKLGLIRYCIELLRDLMKSISSLTKASVKDQLMKIGSSYAKVSIKHLQKSRLNLISVKVLKSNVEMLLDYMKFVVDQPRNCMCRKIPMIAAFVSAQWTSFSQLSLLAVSHEAIIQEHSSIETVLGYELRKPGAPHNCLEDARAAMKLALAKLEHGFENGIAWTPKAVPEDELARLLIHRIPTSIHREELRNIFPQDITFELQPSSRARRQQYSVVAVFKDLKEANKAFDCLKNNVEKDSYGNPQKPVRLKSVIDTIFVRKMHSNIHPEEHSSPSNKRALEVDDTVESKKRKVDLDQNQCDHVKRLKDNNKLQQGAAEIKSLEYQCGHIEEIERLNKELQQRDAEIKSLQTIISALKRKHRV
ncbi:hypothetical protein GIB67_031300 [Kingdonia uniflora]|uniref:Exonuclease domain-containing protein n=1 Tax=Kingdonia uniflora TaxID=39325 RepID=A0A7J7P5Q6_9MAGN|nr:hypothetical protein GIB67_031300 [Kingdonia uniflora]